MYFIYKMITKLYAFFATIIPKIINFTDLNCFYFDFFVTDLLIQNKFKL